MNQQRISAGRVICLRPCQHVLQTPSGYESFQSGDDDEIIVELRVLGCFDLAAELVHVRQRLSVADKGVCLWKELVLDADAADFALFELRHKAPHVVEVPVTGVAIEQDGDARYVTHELENLEDLGP